MRHLILLPVLLIAQFAFAESADFQVGEISGQIIPSEPLIHVADVKVTAVIQFCTWSGSSCAGGPQESVEVPVSFKVESDGVITFHTQAEVALSGRYLVNNFSSCKLNLEIKGQGQSGTHLAGSESLIWSNEKDDCSDFQGNTKYVQDKLNTPLHLNMYTWNW